MRRSIFRNLSVMLAITLVTVWFTACAEDISESEFTLLDEYSNMGNQNDYANSALYMDIGSDWLFPESEYINDGTDDSNGIVEIGRAHV